MLLTGQKNTCVEFGDPEESLTSVSRNPAAGEGRKVKQPGRDVGKFRSNRK